MMELSEKISSYLNWLNNDSEMPDWMGGSEWASYEDGSAETWEFVLLRDAKEELQQATKERDATEQALPGEIKSLDDLFEILNFAAGAIERIPEGYYSPIDDYVTDAFNCMDDAITLLRCELDYRDEMEATRKEIDNV